jgi:hypothetical protein
LAPTNHRKIEEMKPIIYSGFPPFKASQFQFQLIRFGKILTKHQVTGKPTKEFGMMPMAPE